MLAAGRKLRLGFLVAVLAGVMTAGSAVPAVAANLVTSDTVAFKGTVNSAGEYTARVCKLKSDAEKRALRCRLVGRAVGIGSPAIEVFSIWASSDGETFFPPFGAPRVSSKPPNETYEGKGQCEEHEESDLPGTKGPVQYPCIVTIRLTFNTAKATVKGQYSVSEESTLP
jgi:hypothetical protein